MFQFWGRELVNNSLLNVFMLLDLTISPLFHLKDSLYGLQLVYNSLGFWLFRPEKDLFWKQDGGLLQGQARAQRH